MRLALPLIILVSLPLHADGLQWRGVWEWSLPKKTEADLVRIADSAQALGFNALMMYPPPALIGFMRDQCHQRGIKLYYSTVFSYSKPEWAQVILPEEKERAAQALPEDYMYGGRPVQRGEVFTSRLPCYNRPEAREYFRQMVSKFAQLPVDGLAFDAAGFQNYRRCYCPVCQAQVAAYLRAYPGTTDRYAGDVVAERTLVSFINDMAAVARRTNPQLDLTIHIYPWFSPHPYYGHETDIDVVGQTVSWFFRPHWSLERVQSLTEQLVNDQHRCYRDHCAAPFIGFDARQQRNYRSSRRIHQELQIIKQSGAQALHVAELGYLLHKPLIAQAVAEELGGSYRANR